jgi:hypothetical protein
MTVGVSTPAQRASGDQHLPERRPGPPLSRGKGRRVPSLVVESAARDRALQHEAVGTKISFAFTQGIE